MRTTQRYFLGLGAAVVVWLEASVFVAGGESTSIAPILRVVDLDVGESTEVTLEGQALVAVKLLDLKEERCDLRGAVRRATVTVEVDGHAVSLGSANYRLPTAVGRVQVDCPVTRGYTRGSSKDNVWSLEKDARLRLWPAGSPWIRRGTFAYPVNQRWFASDTQMGNDPCYVNACDVPGQEQVYYHYGLDFGGAEGLVDVSAATDGTVISRAGELLAGDHPSQVKPRHDVVYIRDDRGWYYRYSHLKSIRDTVRLGERIRLGDGVGVLGKEGGSGGWSHLHFDVCMPQPSGRYGITDGYAFACQAYVERHRPTLIAVARPHLVAWVGETVTLDATRSWHVDGAERLREFRWRLSDGRELVGPTAKVSYPKPGHYTETLEVRDDTGNVSYDFAVVQVFDEDAPLPVPPSIHVASWPTQGIQAGDEVTFKVRTFGVRSDDGHEAWDFGDGSPAVTTRSDGNARQHAPDGYAVTRHRYRAPGVYFVTVSRTDYRGQTATGRLWLRVGKTEAATERDLPRAWPSDVREVRIRSGADGTSVPMLLWTPPMKSDPRPLLVALHTWSGDYRQTESARYLEECRRRGWAFVHPDFRGPNRVPAACSSELALRDVSDAVDWVCESTPIDDRRIYVIGASGGGHMALMVASRWPERWAAVSAWVPPTDLVRWHAETKRAGRGYWRDLESVCGGPPGTSDAVDAEYRLRSPVRRLRAARGLPIQIGAGIRDGHDGSVPVHHAFWAFNELARANDLADRAFQSAEIEIVTAEARVPSALEAEPAATTPGGRRVLLERSAGPVCITIFEGGHEADVPAAFAWLEGRTRDVDGR